MTESERKHELVYVVTRKIYGDDSIVACGVFREKDKEEAYQTVAAYNEAADEDTVFEVQVTALFE